MLVWYKIKKLFRARSLAYDALRAGTLSDAPLAAPFSTLVQRANGADIDPPTDPARRK